MNIVPFCFIITCSEFSRLLVLRALADGVLSVSAVREELVSEGKVRYDDHCRSCHKVGDLLCCDSCTAVYHLGCIDRDTPPPLAVDDWTCSVCVKNTVSISSSSNSNSNIYSENIYIL